MITSGGTTTLGLYDLKRKIDAFGGVDYFRPNLVGGYLKNARVMLTNGDIVKSTIDGNANDPNTDLTGWVKVNSASQIFDESGVSQQEVNLKTNLYLRFVTPSVFGIVDSISIDQSSKLQSMIYFAANNGLMIIGEKITVGVKSQIIIPPTLHAFWQGLKIKYLEGFSGGTGSLVSLEKGESTAAWIKGSPLDNIVIEGTAGNAASSTMALDGLYIGNTTMQTSDLAFNNIKISGFRDCLNIKGPSSYMLTFNNSAIGIANRHGVSYTASSDSGENIRFFGGSIYNCANPTFNAVGYYQDPASSNIDITFYGTSFDYCDISAVQNHSALTLISCHFENNCNNPHVKLYRTVGKLRTSLRMKGGNLGGGPWTNHPFGMPVEDAGGRPCFIELNGSTMNILIDDVECGGYRVAGQKTEIVKNATGEIQRRIKINPILDAGSAVADSVPCAISNGLLNKLYVESNGGLTGWVRGSSWVTSTDSIAYDTGSRKFEATTESGFLSQDLGVTSGQTIVVKTWIKTRGLTQGYATIRLEFYNSAGDKILDHIAPRQANKDNLEFKEVSTYIQVPQGAVKVVCKDYVTGLQTTGTKEVWFSGERVWLY